MRTYRRLWLVVCSVLATVGATMLVLDQTPEAIIALAVTAAGIGGGVGMQVRRRREPTWAFGFVVALDVLAVALVTGGLCRLLGPTALWLLGGAALTAPQTLRVVRNVIFSLRRPGPIAATVRHPSVVGPEISCRTASELSDRELCEAWRSSLSLLERHMRGQDVCQQLSVVDLRQSYIDELELRNSVGFRQWLDSGAQPGSDPAPFICSP